jgi:hypothetical protein
MIAGIIGSVPGSGGWVPSGDHDSTPPTPAD